MVLAPHTDDGEMGCGGTIAKLIEQGTEVYYTAFSVCEQSVPYGFSEDELENELRKATLVLGILPEQLIIYRYEVRRLHEWRQEILQNIFDDKERICPDIIFMPSLKDIHQDHQIIALEGLRAYKRHMILAYEVPWNNLTLNTSAFSILESRHLQKKIDALKCYKTQEFRPYANEEFVRSLARARGVQIGTYYAEALETVRVII